MSLNAAGIAGQPFDAPVRVGVFPLYACQRRRAQAPVLRVQGRAWRGVVIGPGGNLAQGKLARDRPRRECRLQNSPAIRQKAAQVGQAHAPLAGAGASQRGALDQLHLVKAAIPRRL